VTAKLTAKCVRLVVTEHQVLHVRCLRCQAVSMGAFPTEAPSRAQYGPRLRALGGGLFAAIVAGSGVALAAVSLFFEWLGERRAHHLQHRAATTQ
jgi:hypothetical protein